MTRQKLGDLRDSLVSSVWKTGFKKALNTYPEFDLVSLDFSVPHCDACNLSNRIVSILSKTEWKHINLSQPKFPVDVTGEIGRGTIR